MIEITNKQIFEKIGSDAICKVIETSATDSLAKRWTNAIDRAVREIENNPYLEYNAEKNELLIMSVNTSGNVYVANGKCQCKAFVEFGQPCWHRAAARLIRLYFEAVEKAKELPVEVRNAIYDATGGHPDAYPMAIEEAERAGIICRYCRREAVEGKDYCADHAPYLPPRIERKPEKIGNIRI